MAKIVLFIFPAVLLLMIQCVPSPVYHGKNVRTKSSSSRDHLADVSGSVSGIASFYADKFHGRKTASGEIFDQNKFTAAHRTYPFGTIILVTSKENGKSVRVRINDRGPFVEGRIIDLSLAAAKAIDMVRSGTANVTLTVVRPEK